MRALLYTRTLKEPCLVSYRIHKTVLSANWPKQPKVAGAAAAVLYRSVPSPWHTWARVVDWSVVGALGQFRMLPLTLRRNETWLSQGPVRTPH